MLRGVEEGLVLVVVVVVVVVAVALVVQCVSAVGVVCGAGNARLLPSILT